MMVKLKMIALSLLMPGTFAYAQSGLGSVKGSVKDEKTKQAIPLCKVKIVQNGTTKGGAQTDFDGKFQINGVQPGTYDVEISMVEYQN
ncbi:MAG: carboxypeptidase regulatory-like domain-containing protein [Crocinitomicaceae bacterium]